MCKYLYFTTEAVNMILVIIIIGKSSHYLLVAVFEFANRSPRSGVIMSPR